MTGGDLEANKELVRRFYAEAINARDVRAVDRLLGEDFVHNGEARGRVGQRQAVQYFLDAFSDLSNEIVFMLAEGDLAAAHQRWRGTHTASSSASRRPASRSSSARPLCCASATG